MVEIPTAPPTRICLVRHGETEWNAERRIQGQIDIDLNETGLRQAEAAGRWLKSAGIIALYSSDLKRAKTTADALGEALGKGTQIRPHYGQAGLQCGAEGVAVGFGPLGGEPGQVGL